MSVPTIHVNLKCQDWALMLLQEGRENISTLHRLCTDPTSDCYPGYKICTTIYYFCHPRLWAFGFGILCTQELMAAQNVGEKNRGSQLQELEEDFTN